MTASARGLFRATGNAAKAVPVQLLDGSFVKGEAVRESDDFYPTPPEPTRAFLSVEGDRLRQFPAVWEPAAGDGAMAREMEAIGLSVAKSDLIDRGCGAELKSFYDFASPLASAIVTNPPFQECGWGNGKARWLKHALDVLDLDYMALLLNWTWPGAGGLAKFWAEHPASRVYLCRWKIDFTGQGAPPMLNAWFVWDRMHSGETILRMLDRADSRQLSMLEKAQS